MTKQQKFLWRVQTMLLNDLLHWSIWGVEGTKIARADTSLTGNWTVINEAIWASERIPEEMDEFDAAEQYVKYMLPVYNGEIKSTKNCPVWFARF